MAAASASEPSFWPGAIISISQPSATAFAQRSPTQAPDEINALSARLQSLYPSTRFGEIRPTAWPGVFEVAMGANLAYVDASGQYLVPGFIDAHVHIESSKLVPAEFARAVVPHGTTAVITDPHELANVLGPEGVQWMLEASEDLPLDVIGEAIARTPMDKYIAYYEKTRKT